MVFPSSSLAARITSYEGRAACDTTVQGAAIFWSSASEAKENFAWIVVINDSESVLNYSHRQNGTATSMKLYLKGRRIRPGDDGHSIT
jgi:hypothetical protein